MPKIGIAFGRYSDSPERNGIPAKQFAVVADTEEEMEEHLSRYEPNNNDVTRACDDTLCKGVEPGIVCNRSTSCSGRATRFWSPRSSHTIG